MSQQSQSNMSAKSSPKCNCKIAENESALNATSGSVKQKLWKMFRYRMLSDVCFVVGREPEKQKIYAHKCILSVSSSVFEVMFGERWSSPSNSPQEITVPDIDVLTFSAILRFMYIDDIHLTLETVLKIQYAAKKYAILSLENQCADFLKQELEANKVCSLLTQAKLLGEAELMESCLKVIDRNAEIAFESNSFTEIDLAALQMILVRESLTIKEVDLFKAVLRWSAAQCKKRNLLVNPGNQRSILKGAVSLVRFHLMTLNEFASSVVPSELLSYEKIAAALLHFADGAIKKTNCSRNSSIPRYNLRRSPVSKNQFYGKQPSPEKIPDKPKTKIMDTNVARWLEETFEQSSVCVSEQSFISSHENRDEGEPIPQNSTVADNKEKDGDVNDGNDSTFEEDCNEDLGKNMQIFVRSATGKTFTYDVEATDTVVSLKSQIEKKEGVPARLLRLYYRGQYLKDSRCMSDYNIVKESTFHCFVSFSRSAICPKSQEKNPLPDKQKVWTQTT